MWATLDAHLHRKSRWVLHSFDKPDRKILNHLIREFIAIPTVVPAPRRASPNQVRGADKPAVDLLVMSSLNPYFQGWDLFDFGALGYF